MPCPFCQSESVSSTVYPSNHFNSREFNYKRCNNCRLVYLHPLPDTSDYVAMYPPSYQDSSVDNQILPDLNKQMPGLRFSYKHQFDLITQQAGATAKILDYGCGNGHFIANALHHGFQCDGAEFSPSYVTVLKAGIPAASFFTIEQILNGESGKYDVIRLSNVLEHLTNPIQVIEKIKQNLNSNGILLVEGPIEENFCIAAAFRKCYFWVQKKLRPGRKLSAPPYHIFLSDRNNQRKFFKKCGFTESHFKIREDAWPFSSTFSGAKGFIQKLTALVAKLSMAFSRTFNKEWGNTFIYTGTINRNQELTK